MNHYMAIHPKLKCFNTEFIPYQLIFENFDETYLTDNLHLNEKRSKDFGIFLANLMVNWKNPIQEPLDFGETAFYTWMATARKTCTPLKKPPARKPRSQQAAADATGSRTDPLLPSEGEERMDDGTGNSDAAYLNSLIDFNDDDYEEEEREMREREEKEKESG